MDDIKDRFVQEWLDDKAPTLTEYLIQYPEYTKELIEFVLAFAELHATPLEILQPTPQAQLAMLNALNSHRSNADSQILP